jgi:hypothetical protein
MLKHFNLSLFRQPAACLFWISLFILIAGCQHRDEVIAGVDVPIPREMQKIPDKGFDPIPGFEVGQASFRGTVAPGEIFTFYQEVMEARGWRPDSYFAGEKDQIAYAKGNKTVLISYHKNGDGTSDLTIMVGPGKPPK